MNDEAVPATNDVVCASGKESRLADKPVISFLTGQVAEMRATTVPRISGLDLAKSTVELGDG